MFICRILHTHTDEVVFEDSYETWDEFLEGFPEAPALFREQPETYVLEVYDLKD